MTNPVDRVLDRVDAFQRAHGWAAFLVGVSKKFGDDRAGSLAALVAYYAFFSLFPLLLVLVTVLGLLLSGNPELRARVLESALAQFPVIGEELGANVGGLEGSGIALAIGLLGAVWAGMGAMQAAQQAMNAVWDVPLRDRPSFLGKRLRALGMLAVLGGGVVSTTLVANLPSITGTPQPVLRLVSLSATAIVNTAIFVLSFKVLTDRDLGWRDVLPGAALAGVGWTALQLLGGHLVSRRVTGASQTYGAFALVLGLLSWLYLQAQLTLLGAELNVVLRRHLWPRSLTGRRLTEADERALQGYAKAQERFPSQRVHVHLEREVTA